MSNDEIGWEDSMGDVVSPGDVIAGKYRVDKLIGTGGMGVVVQAFHLHFEERVAIKFLVPQAATEESLTRFEREARAAFKIKSEHVARVIDVGKLEGTVPYMVMEFLEGTDLGVLLTDRRAFPIHDAVEFVLQALEAVAEAHVLGIVHRDLKPENLFLTKRTDGTPCVKVLDFGLSKATNNEIPEQRQRALTGTAQVMGTPQYMSPEQWMSARDVGPATDQWALGVILYELVTGVQPFEQEQLAQLCTQVLRGEPEPVLKLRPDTPVGLVQIINRCLRKEPKHRFPNVGELAIALLEYGPARVRTSVKRIAGVFNKIGVETGDVPPSTRGGVGGLGRNMVLGRQPPSSSGESADSSAAATPQRASFPGLPRPNAPPPRGSQPSAQISGPDAAPQTPPLSNGSPTTAAVPPSTDQMTARTPGSRTPSSGDLGTTKVYHRDPATYANVPDPTGGEPPVAAKTLVSPGPGVDLKERAPTSSSTAVLDGQFPFVPPGAAATAPWQAPAPFPADASAGGASPQSHTAPGLPPHPIAGGGQLAAGSGTYQQLHGPPSAGAALQGAATNGVVRQRRAVTAQSWQHMLDPQAIARGNRDKKVLFAAIAAMVMFTTLVILLLVSGGTESPPKPAGEGAEDDDRTEKTADDDATPNAHAPRDASTSAEPVASAAHSGSAAPSSSEATAPPVELPATQRRDADDDGDSEDAKAEQPKSSNPFRRDGIFDRRN